MTFLPSLGYRPPAQPPILAGLQFGDCRSPAFSSPARVAFDYANNDPGNVVCRGEYDMRYELIFLAAKPWILEELGRFDNGIYLKRADGTCFGGVNRAERFNHANAFTYRHETERCPGPQN